MIVTRILASASIAAIVATTALAQGTSPPPAAQLQQPAPGKAIKTPASNSSKTSPDPTKIDLGKQEKDKQKAAAKEACRQRCAQEFPITAAKTSSPKKSSADPCKGLPTVNGAYQNCVAEQTKKPSPEATSAAGAPLLNTLNKPKYDACMKKCDRGL